MAWWHKLVNRKRKSSITGYEYRIAFNLYSKDGKREVEVQELRDGRAYLIEREWTKESAFSDRHQGRPVGPFASLQEAENFIVATPWFCGNGVQ